MAPRFSVVVPACNAEAFVDECLSSVAGQTCSDLEIVVIDDGSRDATADRVAAWSRAHAHVALILHRQPNRGIGAARNAGLGRATGEFVAFLDADDGWLPTKLERVVAFLAEHADVDLACHDEWLVDGSDQRRRLRHGPWARYEDLLLRGNPVSTSAAVVRRAAIVTVGGFSEDMAFNGAEDYDLWLRLAGAGFRLAYLNEVLGIYRIHDGGITARPVEHCRNTLNVLDAHFARLTHPTALQRYRLRRQRAAAIRGAIHTLLRQGQRGQARRALLEAARLDPLAWKTWALGALSLLRAGT